MNFKKKAFSVLASGLLVAPSIAGMVGPVMVIADSVEKPSAKAAVATAKDVTVKIHKVRSLAGEFNAEGNGTIQNDGDEMSYFATHEKIGGVKFQAYDVTSYYESRLGELNPANYENKQAMRRAAYDLTVAHFKKSTKDEMTGSYTAVGTEKTTGNDGTADFSLQQTSTEGKIKVYVIIETDNSNATINGVPVTINGEKTVNTTLALPIMSDEDSDGLVIDSELKDLIHIYPKNEVVDVPDLEKKLIPTGQDIKDDTDSPKDGFVTINDQTPDNGPIGTTGNTADPTVTRSAGEEVDYEINYKIPTDLLETTGEGAAAKYKYNTLTISDFPDTGLNFYDMTNVSVPGFPAIDPDDESTSQTHTGAFGSGVTLRIGYFKDATGTTGAAPDQARRVVLTITLPTTVSDTNRAVLENLRGKLLTINLKMLVDQDAPVKENLNNRVNYVNTKNDGTPENTKEDDSEFVIVFKKGFDKVNGQTNEKITSSPAAFVLKSTSGEYDDKYFGGYDSDGKIQWITVSGTHAPKDFVTGEGVKGNVVGKTGVQAPVEVFWTTADASKTGSAVTGMVNLPKLRKGDYKALEVQAPQGFYLDKTALNGISFTISNTFNQSNLTYVDDNGTTTSGELDNIENYEEGFLPSTGGVGIVIFLIAGTSAMAAGAYMLLRNRKQAGNIL